MPVNFNLLRQAGPANFYEGFTQGQEEQRVNALAQQKMAQDQEMNALRRQQAELGLQQTQGAINKQAADAKAQNVAQKTGMFRERLLRARDPNSVRELVKIQYADPDVGAVLAQGGTLEQALAEVPDDPAQFEKYRQQEALGMSEWMKSQQLKTVGNRVFNPATMSYIEPPERAPALSTSAPVAVMGADGRPQYVSREQALGMTPFTPASVKFIGGGAGGGGGGAAAPKPMTAVQSAARRDKLGKEFKTAQNALQTTQDVLDSIAFVKVEPGLSRATGFTGTLLPSFPEGAAASAETRLKNLEGKITALGKAQAASTGAIGSIANQEWKILSDQIAAIDRTKGTGPLLKQLELVEAQAQGAMERIRDGYQRQFGDDFEQFPQFADLPAPKSTFTPKAPAGGKPAAGGGLSAAEQTELDQLRKRFGK
jgi:hypothetical protein